MASSYARSAADASQADPVMRRRHREGGGSSIMKSCLVIVDRFEVLASDVGDGMYPLCRRAASTRPRRSPGCDALWRNRRRSRPWPTSPRYPRWGFNGVQTLVRTSAHLLVVQGGIALTKGRRRRTIPTASIGEVDYRIRGARGGDAVDLRFEAQGRHWRFNSRYEQGAELAARLQGSSRNRS